MKKYRGYRSDFLGRKLKVPLPKLKKSLAKTVAPVKGTRKNVLKYPNYSVIQSAERRLPILTACNMHGRYFKEISRKTIKGSWRKDARISYKHQLGNELYNAPKSDFDKGHMTKREDVQWGKTKSRAAVAAKQTFYFTNAVPQHRKVNQAIWRSIEDYILHDASVEHTLKVNVFTGPVLRANDPKFVTPVKGEEIQLPTLFWKVIYYTKGDEQLYRVSFLVGQDEILEREGIIQPRIFERGIGADEDLFMSFEEADTYQVDIKMIERLTGLEFPPAIDLLWDQRPVKLVLEQVNVRGVSGGSSTFVSGLVL